MPTGCAQPQQQGALARVWARRPGRSAAVLSRPVRGEGTVVRPGGALLRSLIEVVLEERRVTSDRGAPGAKLFVGTEEPMVRTLR